MPFFQKKPKPAQIELPPNIVELLTYDGLCQRYDADEREALGIQPLDTGILLQEEFFLLARYDGQPDQFVSVVSEIALHAGGWAMYGATAWLGDLGISLGQLQDKPISRALLDANVAFLRGERTPPENVRGYEWEHWRQGGGTLETWLPDTSPAS